MAPNEYSIFDINSAFGVDEEFAPRTDSSLRTSFAVDEAFTNLASSSPEIAMPQFSYEDSAASKNHIAIPRSRPTPNPWDPRLVMELALGLDTLDAILDRYELGQDDYDRLCGIPAFRRDLGVMMRELRENGVTFSRKAALQAESYLLDVDDMVQDKSVPASTRLTAIQWTAKMGKLEPREEKTADVATGTQVTLNITFANNSQVANIGGH